MSALLSPANRAFVDAVASLEGHTRLKDALSTAMNARTTSVTSTAKSASRKTTAIEAHHLALLEGTPAPEARLIAYENFQKRFVDEADSAEPLVFALGNMELGVSGARAFAKLMTPPLRPPMVTQNLVYLDLSQNQLTELGSDFEVLRNICYQLMRCTSLRFLSLHGTALLDKGAAIVSRFLRFSSNLKVLDISRCNLGDRGANALYAAFCGEDDYDASVLEDGEDGDVTPPETITAKSEAPTVDVSRTAEIAAAPGPSSVAAATTSEAAKEGAPVSAPAPTPDNLGFNFHANRPPSAGSNRAPKSALRSKVALAAARSGDATKAPALSSGSALQPVESQNTTLEWLDISSNNLGGYGLDPLPGAKLVRALAEHPTLQYLDLSRNRFTRSIVTSLIVGLETNKSLTHLILDSNNIDGVPAVALADAAHKHPTLQHLSLRFNTIRSDGAAAFANIFRSKPNHTLRYLDVRDNYIGPVGTRAMLQALNVALLTDAPAVESEGTYETKEDYHISADAALDAPDVAVGSGPILAGSGAQALLALRRQKVQPAASAPVVVEGTTVVTGDGSILQPIVDEAETRIVRMDAPTIEKVITGADL